MMLKLDPIWHADIQQEHFRQLLAAMSRPARHIKLKQLPTVSHGVLAVLATLLDGEVSLSDPDHILDKNDWPLLQAKQAKTENSDYILCDGSKPPNIAPRLGTLSCPEQSATIIMVVKKIGDGELILKCTGPGIEKIQSLKLKGLHSQWIDKRQTWVSTFPLGVDMIFVDDNYLAALPRTTIVSKN